MVNLRPLLPRFTLDTRGTAPERWALIAGGVAIACVIGTHGLDIAVRNGAVPQIAFRNDRDLSDSMRRMPQSTVTMRQQTATGVDYTATASIPSAAGTVVLDPCTGRVK